MVDQGYMSAGTACNDDMELEAGDEEWSERYAANAESIIFL